MKHGNRLDVARTGRGFRNIIDRATRPIVEAMEPRRLLAAVADVLGVVDGDGTPTEGDFRFFGSIDKGTTFQRTFTLANRGDVPLTTANLKITDLNGNATNRFTITNGLLSSIDPASDDPFTISVNTAVTGFAEGIVSFTSNDAAQSPFDFHISVTVVPPPLTVNGTGNADTILVKSTAVFVNGTSTAIPAGTPNIIINALGGADTINIESTPAGVGLNVAAGTGVDTVNVGSVDILSPIQANLSIDGGGNGDTLKVSNTGAPIDAASHFSTIAASAMNIDGVGIGYGGFATVNINFSNNPDSIQMQQVGAGVAMNVDSRGGADFWEVGQTGDSTGANLEANIKGTLHIIGGTQPAGTVDSFSLNNFDDPTNNNFNLNTNYLALTQVPTFRINIDAMEECSFNLSDSNDIVVAAAFNVPVAYLLGGGNDVIVGGPKNDSFTAGDQSVTIDGGGGDDQITGSGQADSLIGNDGNDTIDAGDGNDTIIGSAGNDYLIGGNDNDKYVFNNNVLAETDTVRELSTEGIDTFDFSAVTSAVTAQPVNSALQASYLNHRVEGDIIASADFSRHFENFIGGTAADKLTGNNSNNTLIGNGGNDTLTGLGGNDSLDGGAGDDSLDGGSGNDTAVGGADNDTYRFAAGNSAETDVVTELNGGGTADLLTFSTLTTPITVNLLSDTLATHLNRTLKTSAAGQFAFFENVAGGTAGDKITGNNAANSLVGNSGNDTLTGNLGNNTLVGLAGDDSLVGGNDVDRLDGGEGSDILRGGAFGDLYVFANATAAQVDKIDEAGIASTTIDFSAVTTAVSVNMTSATAASHLNRTIQSFTAGGVLDFFKVLGGSGNDTMVGDTQHNELYGNGGNDSITGGNGNFDSIFGGDGNDTLTGGSATDYLYGEAGDDSITGNGGDDWLWGGNGAITLAGNDTLDGGEGSDRLYGSTGNTTYRFSNALAAQTDEILKNVTTGIDTLDFSAMTNSVSATLTVTGSGATFATMTNRKINNLDVLASTNIDKIIGGSAADTFIGNALANTLIGNGGNDTITGGEGNDSLDGGANNDTYKFANATAAQTDTIAELAGGGNDTLDFSALTVAVTVNLGSDTLATHTNRTLKTAVAGQFANIENATGGSGADKLTGNAAANTLTGNAGNDTLTGGNGIDKLLGGDNNDQLFGLDGSVDTLDGGSGTDTVSSSDATDVKLNIP